MTVHKSFTSTFLAFCKGEITIASTDKFRFQCSREHLFPEGVNLVPYEAAWQLGITLDHNVYTYCLNMLPAERQQQWITFETVILEAEKHGNVQYRRDAMDLERDWLTEEELEDSYFMDRYNQYNNKGVYS